MSKRKNILTQMFDVRPTRPDGSLNLEKINHVKKTVFIPKKTDEKRAETRYEKVADVRTASAARGIVRKIKKEDFFSAAYADPEKPRRANVVQLGRIVSDDLISISRIPESPKVFTDRKPPQKTPLLEREMEKSAQIAVRIFEARSFKSERKKKRRRKKRLKAGRESFPDEFAAAGILPGLRLGYASSFSAALLIFSLIVPAAGFIQKGFDAKTALLEHSRQALGQFAEAKDNLASGKFDQAALNFEQSGEILTEAQNEIAEIGGNFSEILRFVPGVSKVASANYIISAGKSLSAAGKEMSNSAKTLGSLKNPLGQAGAGGPALTDVFLNLRDGVQRASLELESAESDINKVNIDDLPADMKPQFLALKEKLPAAGAGLKNFLDYSKIFLDVLGYNGPRKFLFLFQNNQEMRATGGFIGSYGILDVASGRVKKLFVDDIYNPDGQLKARVIPPEPIQKMSAAWMMHDANWFPDFPTSAEKVSWFYEKTGGPTVDGVVAVTPEMIRDLLAITGPIELADYDTTVDANNFIEKTQYEVEADYDKEKNQPKKFIADLMPKLLDEVFNTKDTGRMIKVLSALGKSLAEKQLLLYSKDYNIQKLISREGWSGEIRSAQKDYLSVINTNINGYKTDGVIDETIEHRAEVQGDGSVVDTVSITRKHNGGNEKYDWWNKVNGDWMRVYVPEGSKLLEVSGQTREFVSPPLDYSALGFKKDPQLQAGEDSMQVDEETGTRIYSESRKTVFANWVYVSPGESATITYKYVLPFKLNFDELNHPADSFSVLYQKQSGSLGSKLICEIKLPADYKAIWHWPDDIDAGNNDFKMETVLSADKISGLAVEKR